MFRKRSSKPAASPDLNVPGPIPRGAFQLRDGWQVNIGETNRPFLSTREEGQVIIGGLEQEKGEIQRSIDPELRALDAYIAAIRDWMITAPGAGNRTPAQMSGHPPPDRPITPPRRPVCPVCGFVEEPGSRFCSSCGSPIAR